MLDSGLPRRVMINQPSRLQAHHHMHGTMGIAIPESGGVVSIHFTSGTVHSMRIIKSSLSLIRLSSAEE